MSSHEETRPRRFGTQAAAVILAATCFVVVLSAPISATTGTNYVVVIGNGATFPAASGAGSVATSTGLNSPTALAEDSDGNTLVADTSNGEIDVLAHSASDPGYAIGSGASWSAGNLYVLVGGGTTAPSASGTVAATTELNAPQGITTDRFGNLLIADTGNSNLELLAVSSTNPGYLLSGVWVVGDLYVLASGLDSPEGLATDADNNVIVADTLKIQVFAFGSTNPGYHLGSASWVQGDLDTIAGGGLTALNGSRTIQ